MRLPSVCSPITKGSDDMKIVILDAYAENPGDLSWDGIKALGDVDIYDRTAPGDVLPRCAGADIVITNKTVLGADALSHMDALRFVALMSTGTNVVDTAYLRGRGIPVSNIPAYSTDGVSQLVFSFILEFADNVALHSASVRAGEWSACPDFCYWVKPLTELTGKTIAVIGCGLIGSRVVGTAKAFGMIPLGVTAHPERHADLGIEFASLDDALARADFVTIHTPLTPDTACMVDAAFISKMKRGAYLINTSRGGVVDEKALADALNSGRIAGAGLDVLSKEPPEENCPLLGAKNCLITPHVAWAAFETRQRLMEILTRNVKAFIDGSPINTVK